MRRSAVKGHLTGYTNNEIHLDYMKKTGLISQNEALLDRLILIHMSNMI